MSRLPQPSLSRPGGVRSRLQSNPSTPVPRSPVTPLAKPRAKTPVAAPSPTLRPQSSLKSLKSRSPTKSPAKKPHPLPAEEDVPPSPRTQLSIREQIALKRAEAKKIAKSPVKAEFESLEDASPHTYNQPVAQDVDLGRWSIKETIERGRSSGAINLSSRDLPCLPSALFEIHLGIKPEPLKSVPVEPPISTSTSGASTRKADAPSWYDAQDLEILKAWSNEIVEIQPEISMFGSLKTVDLHNNKLTFLPDSFADLMSLTHVDLSHNQLTALPTNFWALPHLATLNLSHNFIASLPFNEPFLNGSKTVDRTKDARGDWFSQTITRASEPLPRLVSLDVSHNPLPASAIDHRIPALLSKVWLSENPLGKSDALLRALGRLERLKELHMLRADVGDDSFPTSLFSSASGNLFPSLKVLDLEETHVTRPAVESVFTPNAIRQTVQFDVTSQEPPDGVLRIIVGKRVVKEAWEIEAERRAKLRRAHVALPNDANSSQQEPKREVAKEPWEIEAEQGLLTEGAKRRVRAQAIAAAASSSTSSTKSTPSSPQKPNATPKVAEKEPWEIEAEQGLLSAGARRRARAAAIAQAAALSTKPESSQQSALPRTPRTPSPSAQQSPATVASALANPQYYDKLARTLTLPPSAAPLKAAHSRSFSLASPALKRGPASPVSELALAIPAPTLPLAAISAQPLAHNLKVLILSKRRADPSFSIPADVALALPYLEELSLENCNLADTVAVSYTHANDSASSPADKRTSEPIIPLIARLFPSLKTLDLSYNALTSACLTPAALTQLIFADPTPQLTSEDEVVPPSVRKGLRQLRLRGNRLNELDGFRAIAERFRGNRDVPEWRLEELDLRDNEVGKLPAELGLLPLDVFLVDGNTFRIPPRRVWEREGTKGLLSWLRGRIE
ncbi:hypothetical protein BD309DRAFT_958705 [Dichomitus squalens]|uniref:Uncharacterized protein n=1 Tax=Dichomitus squalens TaxID=114155 RepID=A0A4Q9NSM7_9APHY|nr:hypothetical protein BD309DRAFT_958705 [Dichomitus squalens]TBU65208.1 hypothetical protein BD310DRAFT_914262 [Dichomitus squalens]